jgi:catalase
MMEGFGIHTFRLVNDAGKTHFVKFHWRPKLGNSSVLWDEAVKINGADADFHRRDLWEAIADGDFPEFELGFQIFDEAFAERFEFDVLDATKLIPEELVPVQMVGKMVLNRNPGNFFAETERILSDTHRPRIGFFRRPFITGQALLLSGHPTKSSRWAQFPPDPYQCTEVSVPQPSA